jgi:hypothetical protein
MSDAFEKRMAALTRAAARKQRAAMASGQDRITIIGPQGDGTYVVEFRTAAGKTLAISIPRGDTDVVEYFKARIGPDGLVVPDAPEDR